MRRHLTVPHAHLTAAILAGLLLALLAIGGLFMAQPATVIAAQAPRVPNLAYGQTVPGEITKPTGAEHYFTGCADESVGISVTANDFAPRIELFAPDEDQAIASAVAAANEKTAVFDGVQLPTSGLYTIAVSGRTRGARGGYSVTLEGTGPDNPVPDDGGFKVNLVYGDDVTGTLAADDVVQWNFRGCTGDQISAKIDAEGFDPQLKLFFPIAENALATAVSEPGEQSTELKWTLKVNGLYNLSASGTNNDDSGPFTLAFSLQGRSEPPASTAEVTVISELSPTPTPTEFNDFPQRPTDTPTAASGPRGGHGNPTPIGASTATPTPAATATFAPTPTPEYEMPGFGDGAFSVFDVSSEFGPVHDVAYSPDSSVFATAGDDGTVRSWNAITGKLIRSMEGHENRVNKLSFSPNGSFLASAADDGTVRLWDEEGNQVASLTMPTDNVTAVAFSPDSAELVAATDAGDVLVWDVAKKRKRLTLKGHEGAVLAVVYSPDGSQIATGDSAGVVRIWDANDGTLVDSSPVNAGPGSGDPILSLAYSSDGTAIVVGGVRGVNDASVQIWDLPSGSVVADLGNHGEWGSIASISSDNTHIISAQVADPDHDGPVRSNAYIWNNATGKLGVALVGYPAGLVAAAFSDDGDDILTSDGNFVYVWPAAMVDVFAAAYPDPIGVQVPSPTPAATPTRSAATPRPTATSVDESTPTPTAEPTEEPTDEATGEPTEEPTETPSFVIPTELQIFCSVTSEHLNMRPGPGTEYNPPVTVLNLGDLLVVTGRNEDSSWLQTDLVDAGLQVIESGWVSTKYLFCIGDVEDAPVVDVN